MKTTLLSLAATLAALTSVRAADPEVFDLGNGAEIVVKDGRVEVRDRPDSTAGSVSNSVSSHSDGSGGTVTTVTSERDGQRVTRTVIISPDGKVSVDGSAAADKPADDAKPADPKPAAAPRAGGWMGVRSIPVSDSLRAQVDIPDGQGIVLDFVAPDGPAAKGGLAAHDILLTLDGKFITGVDDFRAALAKAMPEQKVSCAYLRKGRQAQATVTLGPPPATAEPGKETAAQRMMREMKQRPGGKSWAKAVVVGPDGKPKIVEGTDDDAFDLLLNDPNVPETMKLQLRKSRDSMLKAAPPQESKKEE